MLASWAFAGMYVSPVFLFLLLLAYRKREDQISGNSALVKRRRATKEATKRLKQAKKFLGQQDKKAFYDEVRSNFGEYLNNANVYEYPSEYAANGKRRKTVSDIQGKGWQIQSVYFPFGGN